MNDALNKIANAGFGLTRQHGLYCALRPVKERRPLLRGGVPVSFTERVVWTPVVYADTATELAAALP